MHNIQKTAAYPKAHAVRKVTMRTVPRSNRMFRIAPLLWIMSALLSIILDWLPLFFETCPLWASCCIFSDSVAKMFVERAPGQKTTSKPAPEGIINVDVWSSKATEWHRKLLLHHDGELAQEKLTLTITVRVRADSLDRLGVVARLTLAWRIVLSGTTILRFIILRASRVARVECRPLNVIVRVGIYAIPGLIGRLLLQIPGTPSRDLFVIYSLLKRQGIRAVRSQKVGLPARVWIIALLL